MTGDEAVDESESEGGEEISFWLEGKNRPPSELKRTKKFERMDSPSRKGRLQSCCLRVREGNGKKKKGREGEKEGREVSASFFALPAIARSVPEKKKIVLTKVVLKALTEL